MSPEFSQNQNRRKEVVEHALAILENLTSSEASEAAELSRSKSKLDGPMQSKQPDEMIKLEYMVSLHEHQHAAYKEKVLELRDLLDSSGSQRNKIESGSVFIWDFKDPETPDTKNETVIVIPSGGGEFGDFRLLSTSAPLTKAIMGKGSGDEVNFGEVTVLIKEVL